MLGDLSTDLSTGFSMGVTLPKMSSSSIMGHVTRAVGSQHLSIYLSQLALGGGVHAVNNSSLGFRVAFRSIKEVIE